MLQLLRDYEKLAVQATDGELGTVDDFLVDGGHWAVRYVVVNTGSLFGRNVVVSPISIVQPDWVERKLSVHLTRDQLRNSPDLLSADPITRSAEHE